jgi:hypothetical protein
MRIELQVPRVTSACSSFLISCFLFPVPYFLSPE